MKPNNILVYDIGYDRLGWDMGHGKVTARAAVCRVVKRFPSVGNSLFSSLHRIAWLYIMGD